MALAETRSWSISLVLHASAMLIAAVGLPMLLPDKPEPMPMVMTVELLPISEKTNVKPSDTPIQKEQKAQVVKNSKPIPPTAKDVPKPPPEPEKEKFDPMKDAEPLPDKPKEKKEEKEKEKPKEDTKKKQDEFEALLNKMKAEAKANPDKTAKDTANKEENKTKSDAAYDDSLPLSLSEKDSIRGQFIPCWNMPAGAKDAASLAARVKVKLQQDGTVISAELAPDQRGRYNADFTFRAAADSAIRAVHKCSPLKNLPVDKYGSWREMEINFDPRDLG